jgi:hypothetical protein
LEGKSDLVTNLLNRLGNLGLLLIACALLLGGLAGAAIAHHYTPTSAKSGNTHQDGEGRGLQKPKNQHANQGHGNPGDRDGGPGNSPATND